MSAITRERVEGQVEQAMAARAHNLYQHRLLYNPSPECDSLIEEINGLTGLVDPARVNRLLDLALKLAESNVEEGEHERALAGAGEQMMRDIGRPDGRLVERLRPILDVYIDLHDPTRPNPPAREITLARGHLRALMREVPAEKLRCEKLGRELGGRKGQMLLELLAGEVTGCSR